MQMSWRDCSISRIADSLIEYEVWLEELKLIPKFVALKQPFRTYPHWRNRVNSRGESWNNPKK